MPWCPAVTMPCPRTFLCRQRHSALQPFLTLPNASAGGHTADHDQALPATIVLPAMQHECTGRCCLDASRKLPQTQSLTPVCLLPCSTRHSVLGPLTHPMSCCTWRGTACMPFVPQMQASHVMVVKLSRHSSQLFGGAEKHHCIPAACQAGHCSLREAASAACRPPFIH